ncbi:hypothetical protein HD806DRAFT_532828 [Xylariaceae sp. AK1471]|nr:hypothetical protein HD806DRAFT_532828 [Xylariaceae sp. AK1471]
MVLVLEPVLSIPNRISRDAPITMVMKLSLENEYRMPEGEGKLLFKCEATENIWKKGCPASRAPVNVAVMPFRSTHPAEDTYPWAKSTGIYCVLKTEFRLLDTCTLDFKFSMSGDYPQDWLRRYTWVGRYCTDTVTVVGEEIELGQVFGDADRQCLVELLNAGEDTDGSSWRDHLNEILKRDAETKLTLKPRKSQVEVELEKVIEELEKKKAELELMREQRWK